MSSDTKHRIFVTRNIPDAGLEIVQAACDTEIWTEPLPPSRDLLLEKISGCHGVLSLLTEAVDAEFFDAAGEQLAVVSNYAVGFNNIDVAEATRRGIRVGHTPNVLTDATADMAFTLLITAARRIVEAADHVRAGAWKTWEPRGHIGLDLCGKTVGIVGASHIGRLVLQYLQPHDFKLLLYDPYVSPLDARDLGAAKVGLAELASQSDVVSLHAPLLPETRNIFGGRELSLMKDHATLINTARGGLVDHVALTQELVNGRLFAVLDTTEPEVPVPDSPLYELPNVFLTPHIAGSLGNETQRLADCILEEIGRFVKDVPLQHAVKREELDRLA